MSVAARAHSSYARFGLLMLMSCLRRIENATRLFERLLSLRNDPGLLAEEYDHVRGRLVGSFPQAFRISVSSILPTICLRSGAPAIRARRTYERRLGKAQFRAEFRRLLSRGNSPTSLSLPALALERLDNDERRDSIKGGSGIGRRVEGAEYKRYSLSIGRSRRAGV